MRYFFPPEIFPRLASRGIIEVENKRQLSSTIEENSSIWPVRRRNYLAVPTVTRLRRKGRKHMRAASELCGWACLPAPLAQLPRQFEGTQPDAWLYLSGVNVCVGFFRCGLVLACFCEQTFTLEADADPFFLDGHGLSHEWDPVWVGFAV